MYQLEELLAYDTIYLLDLWHWMFLLQHSTVWRKQSSGLQYWGSNWLAKEGSRVRCPHSEFAKGDYSLQINDVKVEDAGLYTCRVELRGHFTKKQVMLKVLLGEKLKIFILVLVFLTLLTASGRKILFRLCWLFVLSVFIV